MIEKRNGNEDVFMHNFNTASWKRAVATWAPLGQAYQQRQPIRFSGTLKHGFSP
jgi:hypothetical protein